MEKQVRKHEINFKTSEGDSDGFEYQISSYFLPDVVKATLNMIFYHRFLGITSIVTEKCSLLNCSYMKFRGNDLELKEEEKIKNKINEILA